jgi:hypothetical protein
VLAFTSYDDYATSNRFVSPNFYSVTTGACNDTISPTAEAWRSLIEHPFALLTQSYQQCHKDPNMALLEDVGIAMGNVAVVSNQLISHSLNLSTTQKVPTISESLPHK